MTLAALNRRIISSADCNWLKSQEINREVTSQPVFSLQKVLRNFLKSFSWAGKCFFADKSEYRTQELTSCIMVFIP